LIAIVGGVIGSVLLLIAIGIIVLVLIVLKRRRRKQTTSRSTQFIQKEEQKQTTNYVAISKAGSQHQQQDETKENITTSKSTNMEGTVFQPITAPHSELNVSSPTQQQQQSQLQGKDLFDKRHKLSTSNRIESN
jgi:uncharacterized membrane protein YhiD involved in acid resistance